MDKFIESFIAVDDTGKEYKIDCYQNFISTTNLDLDSGIEWLPGIKKYRCGSNPVTHIKDDIFRLGDNIQVRRI